MYAFLLTVAIVMGGGQPPTKFYHMSVSRFESEDACLKYGVLVGDMVLDRAKLYKRRPGKVSTVVECFISPTVPA